MGGGGVAQKIRLSYPPSDKGVAWKLVLAILLRIWGVDWKIGLNYPPSNKGVTRKPGLVVLPLIRG